MKLCDETRGIDFWLHDFADKIGATLNRSLVHTAGPRFQTLCRLLGRGLRHRSLQRCDHPALSGAFVLVESGVGAFQKFLRRFAGGLVGPATGILQTQLVVIEFELQSFQACQNVPNLFGAAFRKQGHEFITA